MRPILALGLLCALGSAAPSAAEAPQLEAAALSWLRLPDCSSSPEACAAFEAREEETPGDVRARVAAVAAEVATLDASMREKLILTSVAVHESRMRGYVDDGRCNDARWWRTRQGRHLLRLGTCDKRHAFTVWQLHAEPAHGQRLIESRATAAAEALTIVRQSLRLCGGTLRCYTGEPEGSHPKADVRLGDADAWQRGH